MGEVEGRVAVITGAGSGMGKASAQVFVREGAKVIVADISGAEEDTAAALGGGALPFHCDVTREDEVAAMIAAAVEEFGRVDAVLNVAGIGASTPLADVDMADYDAIMDLDVRGVLLGCKYGIRAMQATGGGSIINWSSLSGLGATLHGSIYSAAKAGVIAITKAAAAEYGHAGIRANAVCPGLILTEKLGAAGAAKFPELLKKSALGRAGQPHEVAELACFLASNRASYISGAVIPVDGGWACSLP